MASFISIAVSLPVNLCTAAKVSWRNAYSELLIEVAFAGFVKLAKTLIAVGCNIDQRGQRTTLMINREGKSGVAALMAASYRGRLEYGSEKDGRCQ